MHIKSVEAQTSFHWCGGEVTKGGYQLRCRSRHLTMVQNDEVRYQKCDVNIHSLTLPNKCVCGLCDPYSLKLIEDSLKVRPESKFPSHSQNSHSLIGMSVRIYDHDVTCVYTQVDDHVSYRNSSFSLIFRGKSKADCLAPCTK
ncbi:hypothetical protein TNCV_272721 [Trichonephila clavipes]|nr:hypothetical protein TNCV_272721 [Trichonephila clavipes]